MSDPTQLLMQQMAQQANTTGLTSMQTAVPNVQVRQPAPFQPQQKQSTGPVGPGQGPWKKQVEQQNFVAQVQNMAGKAAQVLEQRKARVQQQTFDQFTTAAKGLNDAQGQLQTAQQQIQQATAKLQADPNDAQAKQTIAQATQQLKSAQQAVQQNQTVINDIANDPKKSKLLQKGFGIDDKNAKTPERAQAISAIKKSTGVGDNAANILGRLPQTQQLTPQAQGQQMARQAGVSSPPATQGQILAASVKSTADQIRHEDKVTDQRMRAEATAAKVGLNTDKFIAGLADKGLVAERDADGDVMRNDDGTIKTRNMTTAELAGNPQLAEKYRAQNAKIDLQTAQMKATGVRAMTSMMREQRMAQEKKQATDPGAIQSWVKQVTDPTSGTTLATVPMAARSAVVQAVGAAGLKIAKPLNSEEIKRMDLANNAVKNIEEAQSILARRPDMFGPAGWGKTKFEMALAGGDPDALRYQAAIELANLPAVGIHGVRGKWAIEDLNKLDGNLYLNPESMGGALSEIHRSASEFQKLAGRGPQLEGGNQGMSDQEILDQLK